MKKLLIYFLLAFFSISISKNTLSQTQLRADRIVADQGLYNPVNDTLTAPGRVGEQRFKLSNSTVYVALSMTPGTKRWFPYAVTGSSSTPNLQQVTTIGKQTTDTVVTGGVSTNLIMSDTANESEYEILIFPDLQHYDGVGYPAANFNAGRSMFDWAVANKVSANIQAIIGVGDITEEANNAAEWDTVTAWYNKLDVAGIRYVTPPGNHDYNNRFTMFCTGRDVTTYNTHFGAARYSAKPYFVSAFHDSYENSMYKFDVGSKKYAIFSLEFHPTDSALNWVGAKCDSLLIADPYRKVIITTHAYIRTQGERAKDSDPSSTSAYPCGTVDNSGVEQWEKLYSKKANIRYVFSGHYVYNGVSPLTGFSHRIVSTGENGNTVEQIYINYQDDDNGGNGYFLRLRFRPDSGDVQASYYSSYLNQLDPLFPTFTMQDPAIQVKSSLGVKGSLTVYDQFRVTGKVKFDSGHRGRIPYFNYDGEIVTSDKLRFPISSSPVDDSTGHLMIMNPTYDANIHMNVQGGGRFSGRTLVGDATFDGTSMLNVKGGARFTKSASGYGKIFADDSVHVLADNTVGNNPFWFRAKHGGNPLENGITVNNVFRIETNDINASPWWYNLLRLRMSQSVQLNSYISQEIGFNTNPFNTTYLRFKYTGNQVADNLFELISFNGGSYASTPRARFFVDGSQQFGGVEADTRKASVQLELISTTKGFLPPVQTAAQRLAITSPATGLEVYDTDSSRKVINTATGWEGVAYTKDISNAIAANLNTLTYTPTLTNVANVTGSTAYTFTYTRIGNQIEVFGEVDIDPTVTLTITQLGISLPIASALANTYDAVGTSVDDLSTSARITGDVANARAELRMTPVDVTNRRFSIRFSYKFIAP